MDDKSPLALDFDFWHHLYDTIIFLGQKKDIANLLKKSNDFSVSAAEAARPCACNVELTAHVKD
ncbi:MAG TPA: hypothetical protein VMA13_01470 [Candidatus Saccharimonadales bacterium]|nr:hypothetical protein [Candidatus Saccharimonadales bacterium]